jgi:hypothetical protein
MRNSSQAAAGKHFKAAREVHHRRESREFEGEEIDGRAEQRREERRERRRRGR